MKCKNETSLIGNVVIVSIILASAVGAAGAAADIGDRPEIKNPAAEHKTFLTASRAVMSPEERIGLSPLRNDTPRDLSMQPVRQQAGGGQQGVRANINLLMLMRMVQALNLTEDQIAQILPVMNRIEREKQMLQSSVLKELRELRVLVRSEAEDEQILDEKVKTIRNLEGKLRDKEMELNTFIEEHLSAVQRARYVLFAQDFYRELRNKLDDARRAQQRIREVTKKR